MPSRIYSKTSGDFSFEGKEYKMENGAVDVPDHAVKTLVESHGFTTSPPENEPEKAPAPAGNKEGEPFDIRKATKAELIKINKDEELGATLANTFALEKVQELVIPLWEAKHAPKENA